MSSSLKVDESFDRFLTMAKQGATTAYSVAGVTSHVRRCA